MKTIRLFFFILSLSVIPHSGALAYSETSLKEWAKTSLWKKTLHYRANFWGYEKSLMDGPGFFFSKEGHEDPQAELLATIDAFNNPELRVGPLNQHPQCAFPYRKKIIADTFKDAIQLSVECNILNNFLAQFNNPRSVSLVFSSAYPNNPASMFGHSFLKFNPQKGSELMAMGINYAARVPPDENPMAFIYFGVFGGYPGQWSTSPYHQKIKEYNQSENRDLWEYEFELSPKETNDLILHIWELETNGYFAYYFFDENCSFHVLAAIEAIRPRWDLTGHHIYMIPGESVKNLFKQEGIVRSIRHRPSVQDRVQTMKSSLSEEENQQFKQIMDGLILPDQAKQKVLEFGIEYLQFLEIQSQGQLTLPQRELQSKLLAARAGLGPAKVIMDPAVVDEHSTRPDLGHDSYSMQVSQSLRQRANIDGNGSITRLRLKSAYHDLMNSDQGYRRFSHIDFPSVQAAYDSDIHRVQLEALQLLAITSIHPLNFLSQGFSWSMSAGLETQRDYGCLTCRHWVTSAAAGGALSVGSPNHVLYALLGGRTEFYRRLQSGYRLGPEIHLGYLAQPWRSMKLHLESLEFWHVQRAPVRISSFKTTVSFFVARNWELRSSWEWLQNHQSLSLRQQEFSTGFIYFFN